MRPLLQHAIMSKDKLLEMWATNKTCKNHVNGDTRSRVFYIIIYLINLHIMSMRLNSESLDFSFAVSLPGMAPTIQPYGSSIVVAARLTKTLMYKIFLY